MDWFFRTRPPDGASQTQVTPAESQLDAVAEDPWLKLQRSIGNREVQRLLTPGQPLEPEARGRFEQQLGQDLGDVRVHTDSAAQQAATNAGANAFTSGRDIYFAPGQYSGTSEAGRRLLAHEVAHTVQQSGADPNRAESNSVDLEQQAEHFSADPGAHVEPAASAPAVQFQIAPGAPKPGREPQTENVTLDGFDSDGADLKAKHTTQLEALSAQLIEDLKRYPDTFISIVGHTDATDSEAHNLILGLNRAQAVQAFLSQNGVPLSVMRATSMGKALLLVDTMGREPRNRRVEIFIHRRNFFAPPPIAIPAPGQKTPPERVEPPPMAVPPAREETEEERFKRVAEENKRKREEADKIQKREQEQREWRQQHPRSVLDELDDWVDHKLKQAGVPEFLRDQAKGLASKAAQQGVQAAVDDLLQNSRIPEQYKPAIRRVIEAIPKTPR